MESVLGGQSVRLEDITLFRRKFITSEDQVLLGAFSSK